MQVATMSSETDMVVKRLSVPMGLEELMESLTKEVLRRKPSDIYAFASEHFAQLLEIRDQGNMRGSLRRLKKAYSQSSYDTSESLNNKNNPVKVKSATFGSIAKLADRSVKSPASKLMLPKKNAPVKAISPGVLSPSGKSGKQDRNKSIMEKRRAGKRNTEEAKKKLESQGQPVELESKKFGETSRKPDASRRRHSVVQRKEVVEKVRSRSSSKGNLDDILKPTTERTRRKSNASKPTKKAEEHEKTKLSVTDDLKASKVTPTVEKISPRTQNGKRRMSKDLQKTKTPLPEMSEMFVSGEGHQLSAAEQLPEVVINSSKHEELVLTKGTEISDDIVTQMGHESAKLEESIVMDPVENVEPLIEKEAEISNTVVTQVEVQNSEVDEVSVIPDASKSEELEDTVTRQESFTENISSNHNNREVNFLKSNSESLNIDSEDTDKISESKIDLILKHIEDTEEAVPQLEEVSISITNVEEKEDLENKVIEISKDSLAADQECADETIVQHEGVEDKAVTVIKESTISENKTDIALNEHDLSKEFNEKTVVKIQSLIRGHLIRKMMSKNLNSSKVDESAAKDTAVEIIPNESAGESIPQVDKINELIDLPIVNVDNKISKNDSHKENVSFENKIDDVGVVIKIQALVRGYLARKSLKEKNAQHETTSLVNDVVQNVMGRDEIIQAEQAIDSNVLKEEVIESEFKKLIANDELKEQELQHANSQTDQSSSELLHNIDAIIKIQSVMRGYLTRKSTLKTSSSMQPSEPSAQKENDIPRTDNENFVLHTAAPSDNVDEINGSTGNALVESKFDPKDFMDTTALKEQTFDFLGSEFIHYDSSRYDDPTKVYNEESSEIVEDALDVKQNDKETDIEMNLKQGSDQISENEMEVQTIKFNSNEAFGDDVKPRANSIEKLADMPNCANDAATKIQSIWRGHRMRKAVRSMKYEDLQKPPECDELPHQRSSPEDAKKAAVIIQALFRGYMARKRYENVDRRLLKKRNFEGSLPTLMEVEGEDNKYSPSSSDHERIEETSSITSNFEEKSQTPHDKSESSASGGGRTISDEEVFAMLKQLDDTSIPTEQPRRKSKIYTRSLTFDDPLTHHTNANLLTKSMTFVMGDEFQRFDTNDSLRSVGTDEESLSTESETKLLEETNDISEITSAIKEDVQKLKKTLEDGVEIEDISDDKKQDNRNIAEITKSICEDVVQLEKTLSDDIENIGSSIVDNSNAKVEHVIESIDASTRPVSKDSVTSTDSVDTVIFNDAYKRDLLNQTGLQEDVLANTGTERLSTDMTEELLDPINNTDLQRLDAVMRQGDTLVTDILNTATNRLQNKDINNQFFEQEPIPQTVSDKRQSTTSDELRQLWQDEAATTIQKNYRGYRVRRALETQPQHIEKDSKKAVEDSVNKEITRYLNQITAPLRRAFSADKSLGAVEDRETSSKKRVHSASLETPNYVYIPLRDYSDEEKNTPEQISEIILPDNLEVLNIEELNNNNQAVKNEETAKKELSISDVKAESVTKNDKGDNTDKITPVALEDNRTNTDSKAEDVDQETNDKISACISAVVAPITKRFQPVESPDDKDTSEVVPRLGETEPVYQYIPLRNYSEEESKQNESVPIRSVNIAASDSILKEELNVSKHVEITNETPEVHKQTQSILSESISETIQGETVNDSLHENLKFGEADIELNQVKEDATLPSQHKGEFASKEINEYIDSIVDPIKKNFSYNKVEPALVKEAQPVLHQEEPASKYIPLKDYSTEEAVGAEHITESSNDAEFKETTETIAKNTPTGGTISASEQGTKGHENKTLEVVQELEITDNGLSNSQAQQIEIAAENLTKNADEEFSLQNSVGKEILDLKTNLKDEVTDTDNTMLSLNEDSDEGTSKNLEGNRAEAHINTQQIDQRSEANEEKIIEKDVIAEHTTESGNEQELKDITETITTAKNAHTGDIISISEEETKEGENQTLEVVQELEVTDNGLVNFQTQQMEIASENLIKNADEELNLQNGVAKGIIDLETNSIDDGNEIVNKMLSLKEDSDGDKSKNLKGNQEKAHINARQIDKTLEANEEKTSITEKDDVGDQNFKETTAKNATVEGIRSAREEESEGDENKTLEEVKELETTDNGPENFQTHQIETVSQNLIENENEKPDLQDNVGNGILDLGNNSKVEVTVNVNKMLSLNEELNEGTSNNLEGNQEAHTNAQQIDKKLETKEDEISIIEDVTLQKVVEQLTDSPDKPDEVDADANNVHIDAEGAHPVNLHATPIESIPQDIERENIELSTDNATVIQEKEKSVKDTEHKQELINDTTEVIEDETSPSQNGNEIIKPDSSHDTTETNKDAIIDDKLENMAENINDLKDTSVTEKSEFIDQVVESNESIKGPHYSNSDDDKNENKFQQHPNKINLVADNLTQDNVSQPVDELHENVLKIVEEIETSPHTSADKVIATTESEKTVEETTDTSDQISDIVTEINDTTIDSQGDNLVNEENKSVNGTDVPSTARTTSSDILSTQENEATGGSMDEKYIEVSNDQKVDEDIKEQLSSSNGDSSSTSHDIIRIEIKDKTPIENLIHKEKPADQRLEHDTSSIDNSMSEEEIEKREIHDVSVHTTGTRIDTSEINSKCTNNILDDEHNKSGNDTMHQAGIVANKEDERQIEQGKEENKEFEGKIQTDQVVEEPVSKQDIRANEESNNKEAITAGEEIHEIVSPTETLLQENLHSSNEEAASSTVDQNNTIPNEETSAKVLENSADDDEFQAKIEDIESEIETVLGKITSVADNGEDVKSEIINQTEIDVMTDATNTILPILNSENLLDKHLANANDVTISVEKQISDDKPKIDSDNVSGDNGVQPVKIEKVVDMESMTENILTNTTITPASPSTNDLRLSDCKIQDINFEKQTLDGNYIDTKDDTENRIKSSEAIINADAIDLNVEEDEQNDTFTNKTHADLLNNTKDDIERNQNNAESNIIVIESKKQTSDQNESSLNMDGSNVLNKLDDKTHDMITAVDTSQHEGANREDTGTHNEEIQKVDSQEGPEQTVVGNENTENKVTNAPKEQEEEYCAAVDNEVHQHLDEHILSKEYADENIASLHEDISNNLKEQDTNKNNLIDQSCDDQNLLHKTNMDEVTLRISTNSDTEDKIKQEVIPEASSIKHDTSKLHEQDTVKIQETNQIDENLINEPQQQDLVNTQLTPGSENVHKQVEEINFENPVPPVENDSEKETTEENKEVEIIKSDFCASDDAKNLKEEDYNLVVSELKPSAHIKEIVSDIDNKISDEQIDVHQNNSLEVETAEQTIPNDLSPQLSKLDLKETVLVYDNITNDNHGNQQTQKDEEVEKIRKDSKSEKDPAHDTMHNHESAILEKDVSNGRIQEELKEGKLQENHEDVKDNRLQENNEENKLSDVKDGKLQENHKETKMQDDTSQEHQSNELEENKKIENLQQHYTDDKLEEDHQNEKLQPNHQDDELKEDQKYIAENHASSPGLVSESAKHEENSKEGVINKSELTDFKQLSMRDAEKDNIIFPEKKVEYDLPDLKPEQILTSMPEESAKDVVVLHTESQVINNKLENEEIEKALSTDNDSDELGNKKHGSPFYLHQDLYMSEAPSTFQEKKFAEALKLSTDSAKEEDNLKVKEGLLHSGEFHDSIPINIASEPTKEPVTTQTNGIQCDIEHERSIPTSTVLVHSGELHDNILPLALQMNQDPAGIEIVTYPNKYQTSAVVGGSADAQASSKDVSALLGRLDTTRAQSESTANPRNMDTEKRNNSTIVKKNMESEAATKIQASFRGYQVRKQLKNKLARDNITNIKRTTRRKSLGRIADAKSVNRQSDLEEQSATKIQAGIRGFLVRRRQKKTKPNSE